MILKSFVSEVNDDGSLGFLARISRLRWPALSNYIALVELLILGRALLGPSCDSNSALRPGETFTLAAVGVPLKANDSNSRYRAISNAKFS